MAEPTLQQIFGANATQDTNTLTISKADLVAVGLTTGASISGEKLLTAVLKLAAVNLTSDNRDSNIDQSIVVDIDNVPTFTTRTSGTTTYTYIRDTITVELDKLYSSTGIDPDDY